jgi:hypothetical protein
MQLSRRNGGQRRMEQEGARLSTPFPGPSLRCGRDILVEAEEVVGCIHALFQLLEALVFGRTIGFDGDPNPIARIGDRCMRNSEYAGPGTRQAEGSRPRTGRAIRPAPENAVRQVH